MLGVVAPPGIQRNVAPGAAFVVVIKVMAFPAQILGLSGAIVILGVCEKSRGLK
jgi:hypothetical protein